MSITTADGLIAGYSSAQRVPFTKASITTTSGNIYTLLNVSGQPGTGSLSIGNTTTGAIPDNTLSGAYPFTNPGSGNSYLARMTVMSSTTGTLVLYDRVWHGGSYSFANGTISSSTTTAVTRPDSTGANLELWAEINTVMSATACTLTVTYTNQAGTTGQSATCTLSASTPTQRMQPFALASGDTGIRQITNIAGSAAPTGSFNLVILRRIAEVGIANTYVATDLDLNELAMPQITNSSCLCMMWCAGGSSSGTILGSATVIQG